ncbi:hypothetical protein OSTOST_09040 [Ostertagia ostertagi]
MKRSLTYQKWAAERGALARCERRCSADCTSAGARNAEFLRAATSKTDGAQKFGQEHSVDCGRGINRQKVLIDPFRLKRSGSPNIAMRRLKLEERLVPHLIAIFVPLQGMKGNLDMTFTSRLGTMAHQGRLQDSGYMPRISRNIALLEAQAIFISLFAVLMTFVLESLWHEGAKHPPVNDFLFLGANSLFSMCIASALSSVG